MNKLQQLKDEARRKLEEIENSFPMSITNWSIDDWFIHINSLITKAYEAGLEEAVETFSRGEGWEDNSDYYKLLNKYEKYEKQEN
jgi:hypothetical protein